MTRVRTLRHYFYFFALLGLAYGARYLHDEFLSRPHSEAAAETEALQKAFTERRSGVLVESGGRVERLLADDREGSQHQRFVIRIGPQTVLIAHNIDLAQRVPLRVGDEIEFFGQYEWSERGGTVHWTHHDPDGRHPDGWIRHRERIYQ